jgi:hypothetical protein
MLERLKQLPKLVTKRDSQEVIAEASSFGLSAKTDSTGSPDSLIIICNEEERRTILQSPIVRWNGRTILQSPIVKRPRFVGKENAPIRISVESNISLGDVWISPVTETSKDTQMTAMSLIALTSANTPIDTQMTGMSPTTKSPGQAPSPSKKRKWYIPLRICGGGK